MERMETIKRTDWTRQLATSSQRLRDVLGEDPPRLAAVSARLHDLTAVLGGFHGALAEGLFADVVDHAPRLGGAVARLSADGHELHRRSQQDLAAMAEATTRVPGELRDEVADLSLRVSGVASRAMNLVHDAYDVDLGESV